MNTALKEISDELPSWVTAYVLPSLVGGLLAFAAYSLYGWYQDDYNHKMSVLYWHMEKAIRDEDGEAAAEHFELLQQDGRDVQVSLAAARLAGFQYKQGQYEQSVTSYDAVIERSPFESLRDLARLRKARSLMAVDAVRENEVEGQKNEIIVMLESLEGTHPFLLRTANILAGDFKAATGDLAEAQGLYGSVLQDLIEETSGSENELLEIVRLKLAILDSRRAIKLSSQEVEPKTETETEEREES